MTSSLNTPSPTPRPNPDDPRSAARACLARGEPAIVVEVVQARGSVPRGRGTRMVVMASTVGGTIGGGHLELKAIASARQRLANRMPRDPDPPCAVGASPRTESGRSSTAAPTPADDTEHFPLGPALGQCCGGAVTVRYLALDAALLAAWPDPPPRFHLQLYGAGHVGRALVQVLRGLPCTVQWIDEREDQFPPLASDTGGTGETGGAARIERVCVEPVEAEVATAPPGASFLVLTHSHDLDLRICEAILRRGDFGFLGLIGSRTKRARFVSRLTRRGLPEALVERIACPIGLPGLEGKEPGVIAVAAAAQLLALHPPGKDRQQSL
jgi:xanthine dehydrogenase accessory factor